MTNGTARIVHRHARHAHSGALQNGELLAVVGVGSDPCGDPKSFDRIDQHLGRRNGGRGMQSATGAWAAGLGRSEFCEAVSDPEARSIPSWPELRCRKSSPE